MKSILPENRTCQPLDKLPEPIHNHEQNDVPFPNGLRLLRILLDIATDIYGTQIDVPIFHREKNKIIICGVSLMKCMESFCLQKRV